ncbi:hypothetical protein [Micromonospora echinospora]|uniref:RipA family octameric membrane protein n=1 Tax=Micromonospora echinospora TaxID=1877 RepID=UPI003A8A3DE6
MSTNDSTTMVWNDKVKPRDYNAQTGQYHQTLTEQYKVYVEMADRMSSRRGLTNTFFLTSNSAFVVLAAPALHNNPISAPWILLMFIALASQCVIWYTLLGSYRRLSSAKYRVVGQIEERLPIRPWAAEWNHLDSSNNSRRHWRLGVLERWVPILFIFVYVIASVYAATRLF